MVKQSLRKKMNNNPQNISLKRMYNESNYAIDYADNLIDRVAERDESNVPTSNVTALSSTTEQGIMSQHLRELLDAIPGAVIVINSSGLVVDVNESAKEILGSPLINELWRDIVNRVFLTELDQGELRTADGRQFSISTRPLGYQPGQILLLSDVTQTRQLQRAAQQNLHLMTMGKMMASLAHQIRTPLSSSMLYLSQIVDGKMSAEKNHKFTSKALDRIKHIESMINDMLVFAHGGQFHMTDFAIGELLMELNDQIRPHLLQNQAILELNLPKNELLVNGNKDALLGAIANLCMNALDAAEQNLLIKIDVDLSKKGDLTMSVSDNACGMDDNTQKHLFDPFFTTKMDGTGLGLAVVKSVIESHQGKISVTSEPGKGTRFEIHLPCQQANKTQLSNRHKERTEND